MTSVIGEGGGGRTGGRAGRGGGGGRGRGGGGGRNSWGRVESPSVLLSKNLSQLLRHDAVRAGLGDCLTPQGFVPLARILALPNFNGVTPEAVHNLVAADAKGRFELRAIGEEEGEGNDGTPATEMIRACQGHTLKGGLDDEAMLTRVTAEDDDAVVEAVHGTTMAAWAEIRTQGLSRMRRRHVHLAMGLPGVRKEVFWLVFLP
jgi:2'-phosphotransferase